MKRNVFKAGFDRLDITPISGGIPLAGYGATKFRLAKHILDKIYVNTIALGNGDEVEVLLLTFDWINLKDQQVERFRNTISLATGFPKERILIGATHTHSGPDVRSELDSIAAYLDYVDGLIASTAKRAIADMKPAKIFYGSMLAGHEGAWLNFCKHYKMAPVAKKDSWTEADLVDAGDSYGKEYSGDKEHWFYVGHEEEADHVMQVIRFVREAADDIIMVNFQAHAQLTGIGMDIDGFRVRNMSSDFPGILCQDVERLLPNTHCAFYQGAAGNLNPTTRIESEGILGVTYRPTDARPYAAILAAYVRRICETALTESSTDVIGFRKHIKAGVCDHSNDHRVKDAEIVADYWNSTGKHTPELRALCAKYGFNSPYHATNILVKSKLPETLDIELNAVRIGDVGFVTAPCEMFNTNQLYVKAHSPFKMTFVKAYSCGSVSYIPSSNTCENSYERNVTRFVPGTGEEMAETMVAELKALAD